MISKQIFEIFCNLIIIFCDNATICKKALIFCLRCGIKKEITSDCVVIIMKYRIKEYPEIKKAVDEMSVEQLLKSVLCPNVNAGNEVPTDTPAVFIHTTTAEKAVETAERINSGRATPALIVSDMEYGAANAIVGATEFPSMRAAKESGDPELAYQMGVIAAKEAINSGYNWTFGPCVDIMGNRENPIVTTRTAGEDVDSVITYGGAYMRGLQDTGLIATLKHFPGDGYCVDDQHLTTPENPLNKDEWDNTFGKVYETLINDGAMAVMPGHIALPSYDTPDENGIYPPATVSKNLLTGLLRNKLGFEGLIVSDAVNMGGFCGYMNLYHAAAAFLEAGGDCLLFMHGDDDYIIAMKECIAKGQLSMDTLKNRAYRLLCFAHEYYEKHPIGERVDFVREKAEQISKQMSEKCVKIYRNRAKTLPFAIDENTKIAHIVISSPWVTDFRPSDMLTEKLRETGAKVDVLADPGPYALRETAKRGDYDLMICSVIEERAYGTNTAKLCGPAARNMMAGWMRFGIPVVFVSYNNVYFADTYKACVDTVINTYGFTKYTPAAVISAICGGK